MRIAELEKKQAHLFRLSVHDRDSMYHQLQLHERELESHVLSLDQTLRHIQSDRQEAEDERMEIAERIRIQKAGIEIAGEELKELNLERLRWHQRYVTSNNRAKIMREDLRQWTSSQQALEKEQEDMQHRYSLACNVLNDLNTRVHQLSIALKSQNEKMNRLNNRQSEIKLACSQCNTDCTTLSQELVCYSTRVGQLVVQTLSKIKERVLVSKEVEKIKAKLSIVLHAEESVASDVNKQTQHKAELLETIDKLKQQQFDFSTAVSTLTTNITSLTEQIAAKKLDIEQAKNVIEEMKGDYERKQKLRKKSEKELRLLTDQLEADEFAISQAEKRLDAANTAVDSLTEIIRNTKFENKSLMNDVRVITTEKTQLEETIKTLEESVATHTSIVANRIQALKQEIVDYEARVVTCEATTRSFQQDTVQFKQSQSDCATHLMQLEAELESTAFNLTAQTQTESGLQAVVMEAVVEADKLEKEMAKSVVLIYQSPVSALSVYAHIYI